MIANRFWQRSAEKVGNYREIQDVYQPGQKLVTPLFVTLYSNCIEPLKTLSLYFSSKNIQMIRIAIIRPLFYINRAVGREVKISKQTDIRSID